MQKLLSYSYLYLIPLLLSAIFSLRSFRLKWSKAFNIFSIFLLSTLAVEALAIAWKWGLCKTAYWDYSPSNLWIYNAFLMIRNLFFVAYFYEIITSALIRKIIKLSVIPFLVFGVINYSIIQTPHRVNNYSIIIANTTTVLLSLAFFRQVLKDKKIIKLSNSAEIWIALGAFLYHSATLPLFIFFNYLIKENLPLADSYFHINDALSIIMYVFYLISFLCKPHSRK
jgi:hypothetical protein